MTDKLSTVDTEQAVVSQVPNGRVVVTEIETNVHQQFQQAAFQRYQQSVLTYGSRLWREARNVAHQRDPDANTIEITTPDVEIASVRVEMRLARLRQLRFPFRLVQQILTLATGIVAKTAFDIANLPQGHIAKANLPWASCGFLACIAIILAVNYFEYRAELLR